MASWLASSSVRLSVTVLRIQMSLVFHVVPRVAPPGPSPLKPARPDDQLLSSNSDRYQVLLSGAAVVYFQVCFSTLAVGSM